MKIILASKSPRRQFLLKQIGFNFQVRTRETNESFPGRLKGAAIARYLSHKKAKAYSADLNPNELLITADTIVWLDGKVLNKPKNFKDAQRMLKRLSGRTHTVYTGVCLARSGKAGLQLNGFTVSTRVRFKKLTDDEISSYITHYKPFDKAGSYGAQECLPVGMQPCSREELKFLRRIGKTSLSKQAILRKPGAHHVQVIANIKGSYFNVMGLPLIELYEKLNKFS